MAIKGQEAGDIFYENNKTLPSPTRSKTRGTRNSSHNSVAPRGKHQQMELFNENEKNNRVRLNNSGNVTPLRGSPQGRNRATPSKDRSPRLSPSHTDYYAGFSESPSPAALPKPPPRWMAPFHMPALKSCAFESGIRHRDLSSNFQEFEMLPKAQA